MTSRSDQPRLGASLSVLGTVLELRGQEAWDVLEGWTFGPRKAPVSGERGGGGGDEAAEDRRSEAAQSRRAAQHFAEHKADMDLLDQIVQRSLRRIDVACPPNTSEVKNRSGDLDPVTAADVAVAGWCMSCWRNDQQMVPITTQPRSGLRYYRDYCKWCGEFRAAWGIEPPLNILKLRHDGRRISNDAAEAAVKEALKAAPKAKSKKQKRQARKVAA